MSADPSATRKCARDGCMCQVAEGQTFCGPHCASSAGETNPSEQACGCGHDACKRGALPPLR